VPLTSLAIAQLDVRAGGYCDWQNHEKIVNAVERGDAVTAEDLLSQHLDQLEAVLLNSQPMSRQNRVAG
jgi:DNA-binding GntR family transcriptional regulator